MERYRFTQLSLIRKIFVNVRNVYTFISRVLVVVSHPIHNGCLVEIHVMLLWLNSLTPLLEEKYLVKNSVVFAQHIL